MCPVSDRPYVKEKRRDYEGPVKFTRAAKTKKELKNITNITSRHNNMKWQQEMTTKIDIKITTVNNQTQKPTLTARNDNKNNNEKFQHEMTT